MSHTLFITGTDTDAGKSYVSVALLRGLQQLAKTALAFKPIAAGVDDSGFNPDALHLQAASSRPLAYQTVNPILFEEPCAPHLAGNIDLKILTHWLKTIQAEPCDIALVEGAGGWLLPVSSEQYLADWVCQQQWPVVLVVGMKLGCLNHAMLTYRELVRSGVPLVGWVANQIDPQMLRFADNFADLQQRLPIPLLGMLPYKTTEAAPADALMLAKNLVRVLAEQH